MKQIKIYSLIVVLFGYLSATDIIPAKKQDHPIALVGGTIHTVSAGVIENGVIIFDQGKITALGAAATVIPQGTESIDVSGKQIYPGLIDAAAGIGLVEISAVSATRDSREIGKFNPNVAAWTAYNADSEIIPTVRSNGITLANIIPSGDMLAGAASLMRMDGWNNEDALIVAETGVFLYWPAMTVSIGRRNRAPAEEQKKAMVQNLFELKTFFTNAKKYHQVWQVQKDKRKEIDIRLEAMLPLFEKKQPLFVFANEFKEIEAAVNLSKEFALRMVLVGGMDAGYLPSLLVENKVPVILDDIYTLPMREDDNPTTSYKLPKILKDNQIPFCFSSGSTTSSRNLPFQAGTAVAWGLDQETALRGITLSSAEILGVADQMGSLDIGKDATLIVSGGDILEISESIVEMEFIQGRKIDLDDRHKRLYRKYEERYTRE